jgi:pimeloyl-ACP methyl ester carboxylesterase
MRQDPVLFVHGIAGTPRDYRGIAALDRERFQPWVFYYPGASEARDAFDATFVPAVHGFERAVVVAHSMGGLVTRELCCGTTKTTARRASKRTSRFPHPAAWRSPAMPSILPVIVHSWSGLAPGSDFLDGLFYADPETRKDRRRLPPHTAYHMLFGFHGSSNDGVVALSSQLRPEAQEEARSERGFDETHMGILSSPAALARLNEILAEVQ